MDWICYVSKYVEIFMRSISGIWGLKNFSYFLYSCQKVLCTENSRRLWEAGLVSPNAILHMDSDSRPLENRDNWGMFNSALLCTFYQVTKLLLVALWINSLYNGNVEWSCLTPYFWGIMSAPESDLRLVTSAGGKPGWLTWSLSPPPSPSRASVASVVCARLQRQWPSDLAN